MLRIFDDRRALGEALGEVGRQLRVTVQRVRERNGIGDRLIAESSLGITDASLGIAEVCLRMKVTLRIKHAGLRRDWMK